MQNILAAIRTMVTLIFLFYASWSDYKTREVSNSVWILFAPPAFALTLLEILYSNNFSNLQFYGICFGIIAAFATALFYLGGFGGADAKALMCLALALPFYPENLFQPIFGTSPISKVFFPLTVFSNAVLFAALTAVYTFFRNIFWRQRTGKKLFEAYHKEESFGKKFLALITGYKVSISKLKKEKWRLYPLEDVEYTENGVKRKLTPIPSDENKDLIIDRLTKAFENGHVQDLVWVTPGLPMLIFITAGLITALFFGDAVWAFISFLLG